MFPLFIGSIPMGWVVREAFIEEVNLEGMFKKSRRHMGWGEGARGKSDSSCSFYLNEEKHREYPRFLPYWAHIQSVTNSIKNTL